MTQKKLEIDEAISWIKLSQIQGLGNSTLYQLLTKFGSPEAILSASKKQLREVISDKLVNKINATTDTTAIQATIKWLKKTNAHIVTLADKHYPQQLLETSNPPIILYALGNLQWLNHPSIAMVGSRHATPQGEKNAEDFAQNLADQGLCIVSGLALGIDGAAHRGAIKSNGATIAVVGTGLDIVYPARHRDLAHQVAERGLIISEFPLSTPSKAQNFPRRNRLISGLSLGCLVVEANVGSGSLITARLATEQGREVFAIPGSIHSPVSKGCHQLIKQGAKLVESTADILEELKNLYPMHSPFGSKANLDKVASTDSNLLNKIGFEAISFESILNLSGLTTEALSSMLTILELKGKITALNGGQYQRLI